METKFSKNQICVVTSDVTYSCGQPRIYKGSIVKINDPEPDFDKEVMIFRNKGREKNERAEFCPEKKLRSATESEQSDYNKGVRNIKSIRND